MNNVDKLYIIAEENNMDFQEILRLFLDFYGNQIVTDEFLKHIETEGFYIPKECR